MFGYQTVASFLSSRNNLSVYLLFLIIYETSLFILIKGYLCNKMSLLFSSFNPHKKIFLLAVLISFYAFSTTGKDYRKIDSLLADLNQSKHDTLTIKTLFELGNQYIDGPSDSLLYYYHEAEKIIENYFSIPSNNLKDNLKTSLTYKQLHFRALIEIGIEKYFQGKYNEANIYNYKALDIGEELDDVNLKSECYGAIGIVYKSQGEFSKALDYYEMALSMAIELQDTSWIAACYANAGNVYRRLTNYTKALDYFLKALEVFEKNGETRRMAISYMNIGNLYEDQHDFKIALEYFSRALKLSYETNDKKRIAECQMNIGNVYSSEEAYETAREYYRKSFAINQELGYKHIIDDCYKHIGYTYEKEGNFEKAIENYNQAYKIAEQENDKLTLAEILVNLSNIYFQKKNYQKSIEYADKSLKLSLKTGDPHAIKDANFNLSAAWEAIGNTDKALAFYKDYSTVKDSIFNNEKYKSIKDIEMKYESAQKEQQLALLKEKNQVQLLTLSRQNRIFYSIIIGIALLLFISYILYRNSRLKAKHKSVELEQKLLRSQMNPHFIFNSLIAIQSYIYKKEPVMAGDFLAKFADLVRITLENSRVEFVKMEKEIKMLKVFLDLQALRFDNKFTYQIDVDGHLNIENILIPPMLAQPFIENAIEHGLRHRKEIGDLHISFKKHNHYILCSVTDNGVGRETSKELEQKREHQSMATSITKERLEILSKKLKAKFLLEIIDKKEIGRAHV